MTIRTRFGWDIANIKAKYVSCVGDMEEKYLLNSGFKQGGGGEKVKIFQIVPKFPQVPSSKSRY